MKEPIAIVGVACRFPGAEGVDAFWEVLRRGLDCITEVPADRWNMDAYYDAAPAGAGKSYCRWGGFLEQGDSFDAKFFDISAHDAMRMDPQQGLVLETAWQALESAGILPRSLAASRSGVFVGISNSDWDRMWSRDTRRLDVAYVSGASYSVAANRISYFLNLQGPSVAVDTACSSALTAIHLACQSLLTGECELALAGAVHLILCADKLIAFSDGKSLARDGRCKTFDARADGSVWGEGCAVLVLKRLSCARQAGDPIVGLIRGSAIGHYGLSNGIGAPSGPGQQSIVDRAIDAAGLRPEDLSYVETHGASTPVGDAIEVKALMALLSRGRPPGRRCVIGCVKGNIGHLEAAAGMAGVVKTLLAMKHEHLPPTMHFRELSSHLPVAGTAFAIHSQGLPWPRAATPRRAGVSAFSFGGAGAHVVLEEAPSESARLEPGEPSRTPLPLVISARSRGSLLALANRYLEYLSRLAVEDDTAGAFAEVCRTAALCRTHFLHRLALVAERPREARELLHGILAASDYDEVKAISRAPRRAPPLKLVPGAWAGDAEALAKALPGCVLTTGQPNMDAAAPLAEVVAAAYLRGQPVHWNALFGSVPANRRALPLYAFERRRHYPVLDPHSAGFEPLIARRQEGQVEVRLATEGET
jgi:acyl transferase domain-containing protein